ncbi:hypothetical protein YC2023_042326 [Brassica napus]
METINFPTYHVLQKVKVIYTTSGIISSPDCTDDDHDAIYVNLSLIVPKRKATIHYPFKSIPPTHI